MIGFVEQVNGTVAAASYSTDGGYGARHVKVIK